VGAAAVILPVSLGVGSGILVLFSILKIVPATDPHRRGRSIIISSEDMDSSQLQVLGLLSLMVLTVITAVFSVPGIIGVATKNVPLEVIGIAISVTAGVVGYWLLGNIACKRLENSAPELLLEMGKGRSSRTDARDDKKARRRRRAMGF
jgi:ABC-2 type transport system permease protein